MINSFRNSVQFIEGHNSGMMVKAVFQPFLPGSTMQEKKEYCSSKLDHIRKMLTYEPRGGSNHYGALVTAPVTRDGHFGAIYFDPSGWHDMCGHATMFLGSLAVQRGLIPINEKEPTKILIDTPAGRVTVFVHSDGAKEIKRVSLVNVPSFVHSIQKVSLKGIGDIEIPIIFGGDFYGIVDLDSIGMKFNRNLLPRLFEMTSEIFNQLYDGTFIHPTMKQVRGLYGVRYHSMIDPTNMKIHGVLLFGSDRKIVLDRSPSGTSSSAHLAYLYFLKKSVKMNERVEFQSAIGTSFTARAIEEVRVGKKRAIIPEISTTDKGCYITGFATYVEEIDDRLGSGIEPLSPF